MNWVKKIGLLLPLLLVMSMYNAQAADEGREQDTKRAANTASSWWPRWASREPKKQHTRTKSSWLAMDNHVQISPEIEQKITELQKFASKLVFQISETIQGSSELQSLTKIQQTLQNLIVTLPSQKTAGTLFSTKINDELNNQLWKAKQIKWK